MVNQTPPDWMPDAIPTEFGWKDPRTGEIILGITGLDTNPPVEEDETPAEPAAE